MRIRTFIVAGFIGVMSQSALAAEYADFLRDLAEPYAHYRQSLVLTSNSSTIDKATQEVSQFALGWERLATRYAGDPPKPFAGITDFKTRIARPLEISKEAAALLKQGKVNQAHAVLEEVRYLLWDMRIRSGINSIADKANDFHEVMEVVLDHAAAATDSEELKSVATRYGSWFLIKWDEHALASDLATVRAEFDNKFADGRKVIVSYIAALGSGDREAARKLAGPVKNAYKAIWAIDPKA
jgi:hypothetical protein